MPRPMRPQFNATASAVVARAGSESAERCDGEVVDGGIADDERHAVLIAEVGESPSDSSRVVAGAPLANHEPSGDRFIGDMLVSCLRGS